MAATLSAGVNSLILKLDTPYDTIRTTDIRDDLVKVLVWCSASPIPAVPLSNTLVFDGLSLSIVIPKLADLTSLVAGTPYYVKYAFISDIQVDVFTVSAQLTATPVAATSQTVDISGYSAFVKNVLGTALTPPNAILTAITNGILLPQYAWTITGGTLSSSNTISTTVTPSLTATSVSVTLSVTGTGLVTPIVKTIVMAIVADGAIAYSPPTFYISNYGSTFRKDVSGTIYPSTVIIETGYSNFKTSPAPTFQWQKDSVNITGATSFSYTVPFTDYSASTSHIYSCVISGTDLSGTAKSITSSTTIPLISDGSTGPRNATGYIYYQTAVAPAPVTPTASNYDFSTGQFATLTTGWGYSPISASTSDTTLKAWVSRYSVAETTYGIATGAATIIAPSAGTNFSGIVTFSNYASGTTPLATAASVSSKLSAQDLAATGTTVIDGARITTGVIATQYLNLSGVLTATSVSNTGTTQIDGGRIKSGIIDAQYLSLTGVLKVSSTNGDGSVNTTTTINGGSIQTGSISADRLSIGQTTAANRIRMYDNRIEIWAERWAGDTTGARRVVLGDLS